jgi:hypothetical protein
MTLVMATTLLRLGLWTLILVLALFVVRETYSDQPLAEMIPTAMLQQVLIVAALAVVAGLIFRVLGKGAKKVIKNRCVVCKTAIPPGAIYCRAHLRSILADEDDKSHATRTRR